MDEKIDWSYTRIVLLPGTSCSISDIFCFCVVLLFSPYGAAEWNCDRKALMRLAFPHFLCGFKVIPQMPIFSVE
jgi:hypothetical protein